MPDYHVISWKNPGSTRTHGSVFAVQADNEQEAVKRVLEMAPHLKYDHSIHGRGVWVHERDDAKQVVLFDDIKD